MTGRGDHYDDLEIRDPEQREGSLLEALRDQIGNAKQNSPAWGASCPASTPTR